MPGVVAFQNIGGPDLSCIVRLMLDSMADTPTQVTVPGPGVPKWVSLMFSTVTPATSAGERE